MISYVFALMAWAVISVVILIIALNWTRRELDDVKNELECTRNELEEEKKATSIIQDEIDLINTYIQLK